MTLRLFRKVWPRQRRWLNRSRPVGCRACGCGTAITAVVPSAADPVSLQTAAGFSAQARAPLRWRLKVWRARPRRESAVGELV